MPTDLDALIIGAGPAGSSAAALLHRAGARVLVIEKQHFPRFVIGESLLPHSMELLEEAGLLEAVKAQGFIDKYGAVFKQGEKTCAFDFGDQFTHGWSYTYQVPRADFDQTLASAAAALGAPFRFGETVTAADFSAAPARVTVRREGGATEVLTAKFVLDCSGYGRTLPRLLSLETPSDFPTREAVFAHVTGDARPVGREEGKIWVCLHPGGAWLWIIPFSNGKTSVGAVATPEFFSHCPSAPEDCLRAVIESDPNAAARLAKMKFAFPPQRIAGYACAVKQLHGPGYALVGNATEFLDPIFSSGVTLALASANRAAKTLARQLRGEIVDWQTDYADFVMQGINTFRVFVSAWYDGKLADIFFAAEKNPAIMKQICSVLAGYVWDLSNPYAAQPERALSVLARLLQQRAQPIRGLH